MKTTNRFNRLQTLTFATFVLALASPILRADSNLTYTVNSGQMVLNWTANQGWLLQSQTNNLNTGLQATSNAWFTVGAATPPYNVTMNPANAAVFYRLAQSAGAGTNFFIYDDALASGWFDNGWSYTVDLANASPVHGGTASMAITLQSGGGMGPFNMSGISTAPFKTLSFWIHGGADGGQALSIQIVRGQGVASTLALPVLPANTWVNFALPLSAIGLANVANFNGIRFTSSADAVFYVDEMVLTDVPAPLPIYRDSLFPGFGINGWSGSVNTANTSPVQSGTASMAYTLDAGGGQGALNFSGVNTAPYESLRFWIHGGATGGQNLTIQVVRGAVVSMTLPMPPLPANTWVSYALPLSAIGAANVTDFNGIRFTSSAAAVFYVDELLLSEIPAPLPIYGDSLFPGFLMNGFGTYTASTTNSTPVHSGTASMAYTLGAGAGVGPNNFSGVNTAPYNSLSFWINGGATGGQSLSLQVVKGVGVAATWPIPAVPANTWTNYVLPLSSINVSNVTDFNGIRFVAPGSAQPVFYVDDIGLVK